MARPGNNPKRRIAAIGRLAKPTEERAKSPYRYIADIAAVIQASEFETGVTTFIDQVLARLDVEKIPNTNLDKIWTGVIEERGRLRWGEPESLRRCWDESLMRLIQKY